MENFYTAVIIFTTDWPPSLLEFPNLQTRRDFLVEPRSIAQESRRLPLQRLSEDRNCCAVMINKIIRKLLSENALDANEFISLLIALPWNLRQPLAKLQMFIVCVIRSSKPRALWTRKKL